jgi:hypothetical protein
MRELLAVVLCLDLLRGIKIEWTRFARGSGCKTVWYCSFTLAKPFNFHSVKRTRVTTLCGQLQTYLNRLEDF